MTMQSSSRLIGFDRWTGWCRRGCAILVLVALVGLIPAVGLAKESLQVKFATGTFEPQGEPLLVPGWYLGTPETVSPAGFRYLMAVTDRPLETVDRHLLEAAGAELLGYIPVNGYRIRLAPQAEQAVRSIPFVRWLGAVPAHFKVLPGLAEKVAKPDGDVEIQVILAANEPEIRAFAILGDLIVSAAPAGKDGAWRIRARIPPEKQATLMSAIVNLAEVEAVEPVHRYRVFNQDAVWVHQSFVGPSPQETPLFDHGIFGCDQIVAVADTGQDYDLCYFYDPVNGAPPIYSCGALPCPAGTPATNRRKDIIYYNWSGSTPTGDDDSCSLPVTGVSGHGTHTSGSVAGKTSPYADCVGFTTPNRMGGDGQAPGAKLIVQEMGDELEYLNAMNGTMWNLAEVAYANGARIHSHSWGGACFNILGQCIPGCTMPYESLARDSDLVMWTWPELLEVMAAGNAGDYCPPPISVGTPGIAKNVLTVGSVGHGSNANSPSSFSSPGPVFDGRLKPTVAAQGEGVVSADSDANPTTYNCSVCSLQGTSMATPIVSGLAALVREYFTAGYYPDGARKPADSLTPTGALLKAILIDGAVVLGAYSPAPDFDSGYGRVLLNDTLSFSGSAFKLKIDDHREGLGGGSEVRYAWTVSAGTPLRFTLVWTDYPGALNTTEARVNELKLEVIDPTGATWFQTIDPVSGTPKQTSTSSNPHDTLNVEERLVFSTPSAGTWRARVRAIDVPWGPQPYALVVRGGLTPCTAPAAPAQPTLVNAGSNRIQISWPAVSGAAAYTIYRSQSSCPGGPWIPVNAGTTATTWFDTTVSGGLSYSYYVVATSDAQAYCESTRSPCTSIVPSGDCVIPPTFHGVKTAVSDNTSGCSITISWDAAESVCGNDVRANIYRSTSSGFVPGVANRIATCVMGTSWIDSANLVSGTTYYYAVRAEDATTGHGGPCRDGNEETNVVKVSTIPVGPTGPGSWTDAAGDSGAAQFTSGSGWVNDASGGHNGPKVYRVTATSDLCADLTSPSFTLVAPGQGPQIVFWTKHNLMWENYQSLCGGAYSEGSVGQVEIATGPNFTNWTRVALTPNYYIQVDCPFHFVPCSTAVNPGRYFSSNNLTWTQYTGSLSGWGGLQVKLRFHLSGDVWDFGGNWWIDDVTLNGVITSGACTTVSQGPPPVPDGAAVPGIGMTANRNGSDVDLEWDISRCSGTAYNVYTGAIGDFSAFGSGFCNLPPTGVATLAIPDDSWFLVAATNGSDTDGSWARTAAGSELSYTGASVACPAITNHSTNNGCP